jgi:SAM-dependent methyltransferase
MTLERIDLRRGVNADRGGGASAVGLATADAEALPFPDVSFDVVASTSSFHCWLEPLQSLGEIRGILRRGENLLLAEWCDDYYLCTKGGISVRGAHRSHVLAVSRGRGAVFESSEKSSLDGRLDPAA